MNEAVDRIKELIKFKKISKDELSLLTGIKYSRLVNMFNGRARLGQEDVELIGNQFPEFKLWLAYGDTLPEAGQISPLLEGITKDYQGAGGD